MKKKQQEHLQHMLATNIESTVSVQQNNNTRNVVIVKPPTETTQVMKPPPAPQQQQQQKINPAKMNLADLELLVVNKSPIINNELKERIDNLKLKSLNKENNIKPPLTSVLSSSSSSQATTASSSTSIRPKIFVSKQTNKKLQQIAIDKFENNATMNIKLSAKSNFDKQQASPTSAPNALTIKNSNEKIQNTIIKDLTDIVDSLSKDLPYIHLQTSELLKDLSSNKIYFNNLNENNLIVNQVTDEEQHELTSNRTKINLVDYESPLIMFRGYRFSKTFCELNNFESAYSKFYCNSIDIRKPFCPFDLNGSCKDSNCI